ncbi:MAG TPA: SpoIIE family protein phosphatase [Kofleriaceae bacterium]|nr:SpoIIE family protein phosphatase [Kofleriaceae bacterium]
MGPLLERWLDGLDLIPVVDEAAVSLVRQEVRRRGPAAGLDPQAIESLAAAASELGHNCLRHAVRGHAAVRAIERAGVTGLEVIAADAGPGIPDPTRALRGEPRVAGSLGVGLSAARDLSQEMDLDVRAGEGTCVRVRRFAVPVARREVAILSRPCQGQSVCGDDALAMESEGGMLLAVADGLGHGEAARVASSAVMNVIRATPALSPAELLAACGPALRSTRGAVATIARLEPAGSALTVAGAGNVTSLVYGPGTAIRAMGNPHVLGSPHRQPRFDEERIALQPHRTIVLFSDGISARADLSDEPEVFRQPPIVVAQRLIERFGRRDDDVMVVVAR